MVCYAPSTGTVALIGAGIYVFWHEAIGHFLGLFGTVLEIAVILGVEVAAAIALVWLTRSIRRRRAEAGACTTCRFRCQQALGARPNLLVNKVDRRIPAPARPALTCHPAAPLLPARPTVAVIRRPAIPLRAHPASPATSLAAGSGSQSRLARAHGAPRFTGPVPAPFSVRGPVHVPATSLPPSATRVSTPIPAPEPEAVDVDGCVLTPDGVDAAGSPAVPLPG